MSTLEGYMPKGTLKKIHETWVPKIKQKIGDKSKVVSESRLKTIAEMAHVRKLYEQTAQKVNEAGMATLANVPGRGNFAFGNNPSTGVADFYGTKGSGEVFQNLFGMFIEVASTNIGMELLPTIPMTKSNGFIYIAEPIYSDGKIDSTTDRPLIFQVKQVKNGAAPALVIGTTYTVKTANAGGENIMDVVYVGPNRINGNFIFRTGQLYDNTGGGGTNWQNETVATSLNSVVNGAGIYTNATDYWSFDGGVDYVPGFTNFVGGYSGAGLNDTDAWFANRGDGTKYNQPMSRQTGEKTYYRSLGIRTWHRTFEADTVHVDIEFTTEQIQDFQMDHGYDALQFGDTIMADQLNQHINDHILGRMFALGWSNHYEMFRKNGFNLNAYIASAASTSTAKTFLGKENTSLTISGSPGVLPSTGAISENLSSLQRRIVTRMLYAQGIINTRSRRGRGDQAVMNVTFTTALKDVRGYVASPFANSLNESGLAYIGDIYGMRCYEDGLMSETDERINISRHGTEKDPGAKFCPYILGEQIVTIAEQTMAPKKALKSRYQVVEAGSYPHLNYLTFTVQTDSGYAIV